MSDQPAPRYPVGSRKSQIKVMAALGEKAAPPPPAFIKRAEPRPEAVHGEEYGAQSQAPEIEPHIVVRAFSHMVGSVMVTAQPGRVLTEPHLIKQLLADRVPLIPLSQATSVACCPACGNIFPFDRKG